jgi:hypothetical protein
MICEDFAKKLAPEHFDDCGLIVPATRSSECPGSGDVIPSAYWGTGLEGALAFLNDDAGGKPPMFENATSERFVVKVSLDTISDGEHFQLIISRFLIRSIHLT